METQEIIVKKPEGEAGSIYTWMYVALIIIIIISGYNLWRNWNNSTTQVMDPGQILAWAGNLILFFGSIVGLFMVYNRSISCKSNFSVWKKEPMQTRKNVFGTTSN